MTDLFTTVHEVCEQLHRDTRKRNVECAVCDLNDGMTDCQMHYEQCPVVQRQLRKLKYHIDCIDL